MIYIKMINSHSLDLRMGLAKEFSAAAQIMQIQRIVHAGFRSCKQTNAAAAVAT